MPLQWRNQIWQSLEEGAGKRWSECGLRAHLHLHVDTAPDPSRLSVCWLVKFVQRAVVPKEVLARTEIPGGECWWAGWWWAVGGQGI